MSRRTGGYQPAWCYAGDGSLQDARASSFQPPSCFCHTCMTPILVLVTLPSSSLSETQRCRTTALFPTTWTVMLGHSPRCGWDCGGDPSRRSDRHSTRRVLPSSRNEKTVGFGAYPVSKAVCSPAMGTERENTLMIQLAV